jgi:hypothetical protein
MFLPVYLIWAIWAGCGIGAVLRWWSSRRDKPAGRPWLRTLAIGAPLLLSLWSTWGIINQRVSTPAAQIAAAVLAEAPEQAVLVADWSTAVILEYYQLVENQRPDLEIVNRSRIEVAAYYRHWRAGPLARPANEEILHRVEEQTTALLASYAPRPIFLVNAAGAAAGGYIGVTVPIAAPLLQPYTLLPAKR